MVDISKNTISVNRALRLAKRIEERIKELQERAMKSNLFFDQEPPAWDFKETYNQIDKDCAALASLRANIAESNARTMINYRDDQFSVAAALRGIDKATKLAKWLDGVPSDPKREGVRVVERKGRAYDEKSEILQLKYTCRMITGEKQEIVEALKLQAAEINDLVEEANHMAEVPNPVQSES